MSEIPGFGRATHLSIIWGVTLAVLTLMEWRALERNPLGHEIMTPFIERDVKVSVQESDAGGLPDFEREQATGPSEHLRYEVALDFNGPLFLACFFGPVLVFHGLGLLANRIAGKS